MNADVLNLKNEKAGTIEVPKEVFGVKWNPTLVQQVLLAQLANKRRPWAHAKGRGEVSGGGKKPWRQKGTGRARHGSTRSPLWIGGGKAHGPNKERDYSQKVNKKMKRLAIMSVLSKKLASGEVKFIETLALEAPKTKILAQSLKSFFPAKREAANVLMIPTAENKHLNRAASNLPKAKAVSPEALNVHDLLTFKQIFIDKEAIETIKKHYAIKK